MECALLGVASGPHVRSNKRTTLSTGDAESRRVVLHTGAHGPGMAAMQQGHPQQHPGGAMMAPGHPHAMAMGVPRPPPPAR